jgi:hypothetical protein
MTNFNYWIIGSRECWAAPSSNRSACWLDIGGKIEGFGKGFPAALVTQSHDYGVIAVRAANTSG